MHIYAGKFAGMRLSATSAATALTPRYSYELKELRIFLYQLLAQAATHKALYYCQGFPEFMTELAAHLPFMENAHLVLLFRNFLEQYVLNAMPMFYDQVAKIGILVKSHGDVWVLLIVCVAFTGFMSTYFIFYWFIY